MKNSNTDKPVILSFDPGKLNFAYSFISFNGEILRTGILPNILVDLKDPNHFTYDIKEFIKNVKDLSDNKKIRVVFERFVPRGSRFLGNLVEITCLKIGILLSTLIMENKVKITPILASSWKNFFKKHNLFINNDSAPEHIFDAISIGFYYLLQYKKFDIFEIKRLTKNLKSVNFGWYKFKGNWFFGKRKIEHLKGQRNSFGN